jgi:hypothetical protein
MTRYALLLERSPSSFQRSVAEPTIKHDILVSCAVVGKESPLYYGQSKTFRDMTTLRTALEDARIADIAVNSAIQAVVSGYNGFAYITSENGKSLGLLEDAAPALIGNAAEAARE